MEAYRVLGRFQAGSEEELDVRSGDIVIRVQNGDTTPMSTLTFVPVHRIYSPEKRGKVPSSLLERIDARELSGFALDDFDPMEHHHHPGDKQMREHGDRYVEGSKEKHGAGIRSKRKDLTQRKISGEKEGEDEEDEEEARKVFRRRDYRKGHFSDGDGSVPQESFSTPLRTSLGVSTSPKSVRSRLSTSGQRFESPSSRLHSFLIGSKSYSVSTPLSGTSGAKTPFGRYQQLFRHMERQQEVRYRTVSDMVQSSQTQVTECLGLCDSLLARVDEVRNELSRTAKDAMDSDRM